MLVEAFQTIELNKIFKAYQNVLAQFSISNE